MKKYETIKKKREFDEIIHQEKYKKNNSYIIYNKENNYSYPRFGIAVGKKIGNAVTRNKIKRQVRDIITKNKKLFKNNRDYIIIVKRKVLSLSYQQMEREMKSLLQE